MTDRPFEYKMENKTHEENMRINPAYVAEVVIRQFHGQQVDKAGEPYINHLYAVGEKASNDFLRKTESSQLLLIGMLHDLREDTAITYAEFLDFFTEPLGRDKATELWKKIGILSRNHYIGFDKNQEGKKVKHLSYYQRVAKDPATRTVKLADLAHNLDPDRLEKLSKYEAQEALIKYSHVFEMLVDYDAD